MLASKKVVSVLSSRTVSARLYSLCRGLDPGREERMITCVYYSQVRENKKNSFNSIFGSSADVKGSVKKEQCASKKLNPRDVSVILTAFIRKPEIRNLAAEKGLNAKQFRNAFVRFRTACLTGPNLSVELEIILNDIVMGAAHPDDLFTQFMNFAMQMYPHLQCREELAKICDLRDPAAWYPHARSLERKIIFHAGPTNSGKTYHALQKFMSSKSSVYCGPLKMLATEVFQRTKEKGISCDLATGDEREYFDPEGIPSDRLSCTVEMAPLDKDWDIAVIDEIQMLQDSQRGWAWSRALLGIPAKEVHVCGEAAAISLVQNLLATAGETVEVRNYSRLTGLEVENSALLSLKNVRPGDCLVCFNKRDLYSITENLENLGFRVAVVYGSLPPGAKLLQCRKFNDDDDPCNVMVATDAIGMGLNLNIRRIVFVSLRKLDLRKDGSRALEPISVSQALQIAGRAGRYGTQYKKGFVTTLHEGDLKRLKSLLSSLPSPVEKAGLYPTGEQIEMFAYHLPESSLQSILEIFTDMCQMDDSLYFMCNIESFVFMAEKLDAIPLPLRARYIFCCAPVNIKDSVAITMLVRMARHFSRNKVMNVQWLSTQIQWPPPIPNNIADMSKLESIHDVFDVFLWLSLRFTDMFQETEEVRKMKTVLDDIINSGLAQLVTLLSNASHSKKDLQDISDVEVEEKETEVNSNIPDSVASNLVKTGKLSPELLDRLKYEWKQELSKLKDEDFKKQ